MQNTNNNPKVIGYWKLSTDHTHNGYLFEGDLEALTEIHWELQLFRCTPAQATCALGECGWEQDNCDVCREEGTYVGRDISVDMMFNQC